MTPNTGSSAPLRRQENLALVFQEILVGSERLRSGRLSISDPASFRKQVIEALKVADQQARSQGYGAEDIKLAIFAVVAFVDESVLNLRLHLTWKDTLRFIRMRSNDGKPCDN